MAMWPGAKGGGYKGKNRYALAAINEIGRATWS